MSKFKIALLLTLLLGLVVSVAAFAGGFSVVKYEDTSTKLEEPAKKVTKPQYIENGDFLNWTNGYPDLWNVPTPVLSPGWEVHFANMDFTAAGTAEGAGMNPAAGFFVRTGTSGSQYAGMSQQVSKSLMTGKYWVQVHITSWEHNVQSPYNSVAWYGFGDTADSSSVTEWRELYPDTYVCPNGDAKCNYLGRKESVFIHEGAFMHVMMGMKFPDHQAWTVFGIDDISISDFSDNINIDVEDFIDDGDVFWDPRAGR